VILLLLSIDGVVLDAGGNPVPYAYVSCGKGGSYTDEDGAFHIPSPVPCTLKVEHIAYRDTALLVKRNFIRVVLGESAVRMAPSIVRSVPPDMVYSKETVGIEEEVLEDPVVEVNMTPSGMSISTGALPSRYTLVLIDGKPVYGRLFGGVDVFSIPVDDVSRVEVFSGASSALYGSNAIGGVINIITGGQKSTRFRLSSQGDFSIRRTISPLFGSRIYFSRRVYKPLTIQNLGTSFEEPFYMRMDFARKYNRESGELTKDARFYFSAGSLYFNTFSHVYYRKRALKSYTSEYHVSYEGSADRYAAGRLIHFRYGFHMYLASSNLLTGYRGDYEVFGVGEYVGDRLKSLLRLSISGGRFILLPQITYSLKNVDLFLGTGYRNPSLKEKYLYFDFPEIGYRIYGNPALHPEFSITSAITYHNNWLRLRFSYSRVWNYIDAEIIGQGPGYTEFTFVNRDRFHVLLHDGSVSFSKGPFDFSLLWTLARSGIYDPPYRLSLRAVGYGFGLKFTLSGGSAVLSPYKKVSIYWERKFGGFSLRAGIEDIFNWTANMESPFFKGRYAYAEIDF